MRSPWVVNEHQNDYGKDYLVEIGEDDGDLTGSCIYIQLKGQEKAKLNAGGTLVKYSLESKYAEYYLDKIKDLPVFLVVVDVNEKTSWWLFLQPVLEAKQVWRKQKSITISLPVTNDIVDTDELRKAIDEAKKWMRIHHPESIHESVVAHKERIIRDDPRFDVDVSLVNDYPKYNLLAKEDVVIKVRFTGKRKDIENKVSDLLDKGNLVTFEPGEVKITGSKLFETIEQVGCMMQCEVNSTGTIKLACHDASGKELASLSDVPGRFCGGRKERWFDGEMSNSPLTIKLGPIAADIGGSVDLNLNFHRWDGQRILQLAYFDRLQQFYHALPKSEMILVECQQDGNSIFSVTLPLQIQTFAAPLAHYLEILSKARRVAQRFSINPIWTLESFDEDTQDSTEQLDAIFFANGWSQPMPCVSLKLNCVEKTFRSDAINEADKPGPLRITSDRTYSFFNEKIEVGRLVHDYTEMSVMSVKANRMAKLSTRRKSAKGRRKNKSARSRSRNGTVDVRFVGTEATVLSVRTETQEDERIA